MEEEAFYSRLKDELAGWQKDGIIEISQAEAIMRRYGIEKKGFKPGSAISAISIVAAVLIGVGVLSFIASNWYWVPDNAKIALILASTFGTYYAGYVLRFEEKNYPMAGHALLFLGSILVGPAIYYSLGIYTTFDPGWLILLWILVITPLSYFFDSRPIFSLGILIFIYWLLIFINNEYMRLFLLLLLGIALYGIGQIHELTEKWSGHRMILKGFGIFLIISAYLFFIIYQGRWYLNYRQITEIESNGQIITGAFVILAAASILVNIVEREKLKNTRYEFYVLLAAFAGGIVLSLRDLYPSFFASKVLVSYIIDLIIILLFFGLSIGTISIGYYKNQTAFVNAGILFFVLGIILVYIYRLSRFLPASIGLIIGGILLLSAATYLEKKRRELLISMKKDLQ